MRVKNLMADLQVPYAALPEMGLMPAAEAMLMMHPPCSFMTIMACRVSRKTPSRFGEMTRRQSARFNSAMGLANEMPALLMRMSSRPHSLNIRVIAASQSVSEVTCSRRAMA